MRSLARWRARAIDVAAARLARDTRDPAAGSGRQMPALLAVGGYGRRDQFPHSDVDLLILVAAAPDPEQKRRLEAFVGACWDIGLPIGHSVRTAAETIEEARADITVMTSLIELRWLAGSRRPRRRPGAALRRYELTCAHSSRAKLLEMRQRHARFEDTPYSLEPNCKESPGALRDLQVILWIARAAGFGRSWPELRRRNLITAREAGQLRRNDRLIRRIRAWLHILAGRREDRSCSTCSRRWRRRWVWRAPIARRSSEALMQRYYLGCQGDHAAQRPCCCRTCTGAVSGRGRVSAEPIDDDFATASTICSTCSIPSASSANRGRSCAPS